jgi:hypothetical protein
MNPFDYITSISYKKNDIMVDEETENGYSPFMVNRGLALYQDTVLFANEMNRNSHLPNRLQYDFLREGIRARRRFSKWPKKSVPERIEIIKEYYGYSNTKAESIADLVSDEDIEGMTKYLSKGGKKR